MLHSYNEIKDVVQSLMGQSRSSAVQCRAGGQVRACLAPLSAVWLRRLTRVVAESLRLCFLLSSRLAAGKCAELEGKRITEMYEKFGLELDD